jgi:NAD(P)-dependent dehydrogenase (short-subunit alcohol dehydrogenase family)
MELNGTTAIVSGGASGLGEATARELAKAGALVVVADLAADRGETVAADIGGVFARTDVSDEASVQEAVAAAAGRCASRSAARALPGPRGPSGGTGHRTIWAPTRRSSRST